MHSQHEPADTNAPDVFNVTNPEDLVAMTGHADPMIRMSGRLAAAGYFDAAERWMKAELQRGTNPVDVLECLNASHMQTMASLSSHMLSPGGFEAAAELIRRSVDTVFLKAVQSQFQILQQKRGARSSSPG